VGKPRGSASAAWPVSAAPGEPITEQRARRLSPAGVPSLGTLLTKSNSGEVLARSNTVLAGYWENPAPTTMKSYDSAINRLLENFRAHQELASDASPKRAGEAISRP
jgi:hypothetical protein